MLVFHFILFCFDGTIKPFHGLSVPFHFVPFIDQYSLRDCACNYIMHKMSICVGAFGKQSDVSSYNIIYRHGLNC